MLYAVRGVHRKLLYLQGFVCPMCMARCNNPEDLQKHFDSVHANDGPSSFTPSSNANTSVYI